MPIKYAKEPQLQFSGAAPRRLSDLPDCDTILDGNDLAMVLNGGVLAKAPISTLLATTCAANTIVFLGDSITAAMWAATPGVSLTRAGNVVTAAQPSHPFMSGQSVLVEQMADPSFNGFYTITKTGNNAWTYACPGDDGFTQSGYVRNPYWLADNGWPTWARILLGNRMRVLYNAGVGGNTLAQMLARLQADVIARAPAWCSVMGGINDIAGLSADQITAQLSEIYRQLRANGIRIIAHTILPLGSGHASYSVGNYQKILTVNQWIRQQCQKSRSMWLCDSYRAIVDPFSATGQPKAGHLASDNIHPSARGARAIADAFYAAVSRDLIDVNTLVSSAADNRQAYSGNANLWPSMPVNFAGGAIGGTASGTAPLYFSVKSASGSPVVVASGVSRSAAVHGDDCGGVCRMSFQAQATNDSGQITQNGSGWAGTVAVGRAYYFECAIDVTGVAGSNLSALYLSVTYVVDGVNTVAYSLQPSGTAYTTSDFRGVLYSVPFFLTGTLATNIVWSITANASAAGSAVQIDAGRVQLRELPAGADLAF